MNKLIIGTCVHSNIEDSLIHAYDRIHNTSRKNFGIEQNITSRIVLNSISLPNISFENALVIKI